MTLTATPWRSDLKTLSELLRKELRDCDIAGRMGGEVSEDPGWETEGRGCTNCGAPSTKIEQTTIIKDHVDPNHRQLWPVLLR